VLKLRWPRLGQRKERWPFRGLGGGVSSSGAYAGGMGSSLSQPASPDQQPFPDILLDQI
jgi:hypothetical protein